MALYHHGSQKYEDAATEAALFAREKFEAQIARGRASTSAVIQKILTETPVDRISAARVLEFVPSQDDPNLYIEIGDQGREVITDHALGQLAEKVKLPGTYVTHLRGLGEFGRDLLVQNLNKLYHRLDDKRFLTRSFDGRLRGFLSDTFRRLDSGPIIAAFVEEVQALGGLFVEGQMTETKVSLQVLLPTIYEPIPNEPCVIGAYLRNSDYGEGKVQLGTLIDRLWCTNKACTQSAYSQVHLGKRLADSIEFSQETYELDTKATVSALRDVVRAVLAPPAVERQLAIIKQANEEHIDPRDLHTWLKKRTTKGLADTVVETFNTPDVINLPPGNTAWRFSNALSLLARESTNGGEKMDLERLAGEVLDRCKVDLPEVIEA